MPDDAPAPVQFPPFDPERVEAAFAEYARDDATKCKECGGSGLKKIMRITDTCPFCKGSGRIPSATDAPAARQLTPELLAQRFHETYERLAPSFGYETRKASAKPWADVPEQNKRLMIAVCAEILA